jgi:flagellar biosynthetic protein FliR
MGLDVFHLTTAKFETFVLVLIRVSVILFMLPVFSAPQVPRLVRLGLGLFVAFAVMQTVPTIRALDLAEFVVAVVCQVLVGFVFGFVSYLVFMGIQLAGEILDLQIGFAVSNIINPVTQQQITVIGEFELAIATLLFLVTDSHLLMLQGIGGSFSLLPLPYANVSSATVASIGVFFAQAVLIVFKIAAPVSVALFVVNVGLGLMARVAPQMNVFVVGFPLQIGVGMIMLIVCMPLLGAVLPGLFDDVPAQLDTVMRGMIPGR